jgi:hypothetical protein
VVITRSSDILFGWQQRGTYGECATILFFRGEFVNIPFLVDHIIYFAWYWFISRGGLNVNVTFSDWCNNPLAYFQNA